MVFFIVFSNLARRRGTVSASGKKYSLVEDCPDQPEQGKYSLEPNRLDQPKQGKYSLVPDRIDQPKKGKYSLVPDRLDKSREEILSNVLCDSLLFASVSKSCTRHTLTLHVQFCIPHLPMGILRLLLIRPLLLCFSLKIRQQLANISKLPLCP